MKGTVSCNQDDECGAYVETDAKHKAMSDTHSVRRRMEGIDSDHRMIFLVWRFRNISEVFMLA